MSFKFHGFNPSICHFSWMDASQALQSRTSRISVVSTVKCLSAAMLGSRFLAAKPHQVDGIGINGENIWTYMNISDMTHPSRLATIPFFLGGIQPIFVQILWLWRFDLHGRLRVLRVTEWWCNPIPLYHHINPRTHGLVLDLFVARERPSAGTCTISITVDLLIDLWINNSRTRVIGAPNMANC